MTVIVGEVWVALRPDTSLFATDVKKKLEKIINPSGQTGIGGLLNKVGALSLAVVAGATVAAVASAANLQEVQTKLQNTAALTAQEAAAIGTAFVNAGGQSTYSANQIVAALAPVGGQLREIQGGYLSTAAAVTVMKAATDLAEASGQDLGSTTSALVTIMQAFQVKAGGAAAVANILFTTSNALGVSTDSLSSTIAQLHSRLGTLSPSLVDVSSLMVDLQDHGIVGSRAIRAVSSGLEHLITQAAKAGPATGLAITRQSELVQKAQAALAKAQEQYAQKNAVIQSEGGPATLQQQYELANAKQAIAVKTQALAAAEQNLATIQKNGGLSTTTATATLNNLGISIFNTSGKFIGMRALIAQLQPALAKMTDQQRNLTLANLFGAGAAQQFNKLILAGTGGLDKATTTVTRHNAVTKAAQAAQKTLSGEWHTFVGAVVDLADKYGAIFLPILTKVVAGLAWAASIVVHNKAVAIALATVITAVLGPAMLHYVASTGKKLIDFGLGWIKSLAQQSTAAEVSSAKTVAASDETIAAIDRINAANGYTVESAAAAGDALEEEGASAEAGSAGFDILGAAMDALPIFALITIVALLATHWKQSWEVIKTVSLAVWHFLDNDVIHPIEKAFGWLVGMIKQHWDLLLPIFLGPVGAVLLVWRHFHTQIVDGLKDIGRWFERLPGVILHAVAGFGSLLLHAGINLLLGLVHGMESGFDDVRHTTAHIADNVLHFFTSGFGIFSPSKKTHEMGVHLMEGLANGIAENVHLPQRALAALHLSVNGISNTATNSSTNVQHQLLLAMQQLVVATRTQTTALTTLTNLERRPLRATVSVRGNSGSGGGRHLAMGLAR